MSRRDDDHIGHVPKITPAHDEIASFQRTQAKGALAASLGDVPDVSGSSGSSSMAIKSILTAVVLLLVATGGWAAYLHLKLQAAQQSIRNYEVRISDLEQKLSVTDESMSESAVAMKVKLRELDSEVRKLWDNVWKKTKQRLSEHDSQLTKQQLAIDSSNDFIVSTKQQLAKNEKVVAGLSAQLKKAAQMQTTVTANQSALKRQEATAESAADKANKAVADMRKLDRRIKETEEWIESINGFRKQVNRDLNALKQAAASTAAGG